MAAKPQTLLVAGRLVTFRTHSNQGRSEPRFGTLVSYAAGFYTVKEDGEPTDKVCKVRPSLIAYR